MERNQKCENMACGVWSKLGMTVYFGDGSGRFPPCWPGTAGMVLLPMMFLLLLVFDPSLIYEDKFFLSRASTIEVFGQVTHAV